MVEMPRLSVIIPTFRRVDKLTALIESIYASSFPACDLEIIVCVDGDKLDYSEMQKRYPKVRFTISIEEHYVTYTRNQGAKLATGELLFFVDDDNVLDPDCLSILVEEYHKNPGVGIAAPIILFKSKPDHIWCAGATVGKVTMRHHHIAFKSPLSEIDQSKPIECEYVPNSYIISKKDYDVLGGFDDKHFPFAMEEVDLGIRVMGIGKKVMVFPRAMTYHDIPFNDDIHVGGRRAYFRGRSRVMFYLIHAPWHLLIIPKDILGFGLTVAAHSENKMEDMSSFVKGMMNGFYSYLKEK